MTLVARLKVALLDVEPQVLRRFDVPLKIKLSRLQRVSGFLCTADWVHAS